jgi:hypothetical protein
LKATFGIYVGRGDVDGVTYDHLAFSGAEADFQIWSGGSRRYRKNS